jgi:hypothetical protein
LKLEEFWKLTPYEYALITEAAADREMWQCRFTAAMVANVINTCKSGKLREPITADLLLGREPNRVRRRKKRSKFVTPEGRAFAKQQREQQAKAKAEKLSAPQMETRRER